MALMSFRKTTISAVELQRQMNKHTYSTVYMLMQKIRRLIGKRDALYSLEGEIEFDDGYFEKATSTAIKIKRGRGGQL